MFNKTSNEGTNIGYYSFYLFSLCPSFAHISALGQERLIHIIRWALVADEAMALIIQAEEILSEQALHDLRICVNANQPERWSVYRTGDRRMKAITGKELWEHPMFTTSLGELLNTSLNE